MAKQKYIGMPAGTAFSGNLEDCMKSKGQRFSTVSDLWQARLVEVYNEGPARLCNGTFIAYSGIVIADDVASMKVVPDLNRLLSQAKTDTVDGMLRIRYSEVPTEPLQLRYGRDNQQSSRHMRDQLEKALIPSHDLRMDYFWDVHTMHCHIDGNEPEPIRIAPRIYTPNRIMLEMRGFEDAKGAFGYLQMMKLGPVSEGSAMTSAWVTSPGCYLTRGSEAAQKAQLLDYSLLHLLQSAARDCFAKDGRMKSKGRRDWNELAIRAGNGDLTELLRQMRAQEGKMAQAIELARNGAVDDATFRKLIRHLLIG